MTFSARDRKRATAVTASMNVETTWRFATRGNTCVVRATGGQVVPVRVERVGARGEEALEWVRKGWRIVAAPALAGVDLGGGGIRIWELKPSKELKRITVARISPDCVCLSAYPSIPLYFGLSVRAFVNGLRPCCGHRVAECGFIRLQASAEFLQFQKISGRSIKIGKFASFLSSHRAISLFYCDFEFSVCLLESWWFF